MHVRFSPCLGMSVIEDLTEDVLGTIGGALINPDTGLMEGFTVLPSGLFFHKKPLFLSRFDIVHWGRAVRIRDHRSLTEADDMIRLQSLLTDPRTMLGQRMKTESGMTIGTCRDVQFNTKTFAVEWLFPRRFFQWGLPVPVSEISEIRPDAIIIRDPGRPKAVKQAAEPTILETIEKLAEPPIPQPTAPS